MTRKDYVRLSKALSQTRMILMNAMNVSSDHMDGFDIAVGTVAKALSVNNPKFDQTRFRDDVGL